jgi:AcrR family transcriptional regulator
MSIAVARRKREKQALRDKIMDAARELFAERGYQAVTMREIAERVEYTPTAIYYHFRDKDALIRELCIEDFDALAHEFEALAAISDPVERFRALGQGYVAFALAHPNQYRLMFMTPDAPDLGDAEGRKGNPDRDGYAFLKWTVGEMIAHGRVRPEYHDADLTAQTVWSAVHGLIALHLDKGTTHWNEWRPMEARVPAMLNMIIAGIARPEE